MIGAMISMAYPRKMANGDVCSFVMKGLPDSKLEFDISSQPPGAIVPLRQMRNRASRLRIARGRHRVSVRLDQRQSANASVRRHLAAPCLRPHLPLGSSYELHLPKRQYSENARGREAGTCGWPR